MVHLRRPRVTRTGLLITAATAAVALGIPVAHLSGGEATEGLFDDQLRHAITKMSHLHFASMERYRRRIVRMGEPPERVHAVGEPGLDHLRRTRLLARAEASTELGLDLERPTALVTFHPVTLELERTGEYVAELLAALDRLPELQLLMTYPGADPSATAIVDAFDPDVAAAWKPEDEFFRRLSRPQLLAALGDDVDVNPSGGALAANPMMAVGLSRFAEAARAIRDRGVHRAVAHATSGQASFSMV